MRGLRWAKLGVLVAMSGLLVGCCMVDPPPQANFTWSPAEPCARTQVQFTDTSVDAGGPQGGGGITSWSWDFGDGGTSTAQNPVHEYQRSGTYQVRLTVTDSCGSTSTVQKTIHVSPSLSGSWSGVLVDAAQRSWMLILELNHSYPGDIITGTAYVTNLPSTIMSAQFNRVTREVQITFAYGGTGNTWLLVGVYDPSRDCMSGHWENVTLAPGVRVGTWEVCRR